MIVTAPAKRLSTSVNGNPRYLVELDNVKYATVVDSQAGYAATNFEEGAEVSATISMGQVRVMEDA